MLTRWEECLLGKNKLDDHERFKAECSIAHINGFLNRPIVNEYAEMLLQMLKSLGYKKEEKRQGFKLIPTHDIDAIRYPNTLKTIIGDIIKRKNFRQFKYRTGTKIKRTNPFNTFSWLMDLSEKQNLVSRFYFMSGGTSDYDNWYSIHDPLVERIVTDINNRGHIIGFHPSYNTVSNAEQYANEKEKLETVIKKTVDEGRQHFMRFKNPDTWRIWEESRMKIDSSVGYPSIEGFRCGTGCEYSVFDVFRRKRLELKERPLVLMEGTIWQYRKLSHNKCHDIFLYYNKISKKYEMPFTILFHNSSFDKILWPEWKELYKSMLS